MKFCMASVLTFLISSVALAGNASQVISGTITVAAGLEQAMVPNGVLFIFAKKLGGPGTPPAAVLRIPQPKFPYAFSLSAANAMMPGTPFDGPFTITARYSPSGDAMDKSGPEGQDTRANIKPGQKDVKIELKKAK